MYADAVAGISSFSRIAISAVLRRAMSRQRLPSDGHRPLRSATRSRADSLSHLRVGHGSVFARTAARTLDGRSPT